jgi:hypothetical protein
MSRVVPPLTTSRHVPRWERSDWAPRCVSVPKSGSKDRNLQRSTSCPGPARTGVFAGISPPFERFCSTTENRGVSVRARVSPSSRLWVFQSAGLNGDASNGSSFVVISAPCGQGSFDRPGPARSSAYAPGLSRAQSTASSTAPPKICRESAGAGSAWVKAHQLLALAVFACSRVAGPQVVQGPRPRCHSRTG